MVGLVTRLQEGFAKGRVERGLVRHCFPHFVTGRSGSDTLNILPVFCFHAVKAEEFEAALHHLQRNDYRTLTADGVVNWLNGDSTCEKAVALTFDDGWRSTWSVAYPLLKKYGFCGISFLVPSWMHNEPPGDTLESNWDGKCSLQEIHDLEPQNPYLSWAEAAIMQEDGVFEFQSHSLTHDTVFTSNRLVDFVNPAFRRVPHKIPVVPGMDADPWRRSEALGMPLYTVAPRLTGALQCIVDADLRERCLKFVEDQGGERFFSHRDWRTKLSRFYAESGLSPKKPNLISAADRDAGIRHELLASKQILEQRLGKPVTHFCFPFFAGSELASRISAELGYVSNYWGWKPPSDARKNDFSQNHLYAALDETDYSTGDALQGRRSNAVGDDPLRIVRVPGDYVHRLPGRGRRSLGEMFLRKCIRNLRK